MELPSCFNDLLSEIRLTKKQREDAIRGHKTLTDRLKADPDLTDCIVATFLQGSYSRGTSIRPQGDARSDVDVVVVTNLDRNAVTPQEAHERFRPFLERHYSGKFTEHDRSFGIELSYVDLDLVITSAPSESTAAALASMSMKSIYGLDEVGDWRLNEAWVDPDQRTDDSAFLRLSQEQAEWKTEPLFIPDRNLASWEQTHPIAQKQWTRDKNAATDGRFINVVKVIKWLHRIDESMPTYPKGYLIEHLAGETCPDECETIAGCVTASLEEIASRYRAYAERGSIPFMPDHGLPSQNVFARVSPEDFKKFHRRIQTVSTKAREALDDPDASQSAEKWRELFGSMFPRPSGGGGSQNNGRFTSRRQPTVPAAGRFA